jgi:serine/threonine-protein kinase
MSSISDPLILPPDVILLPVSQLSEQVRRQFSSEEGDYAITRLHSRTPSKIIDSQAAELLDGFRTGATIVEVIRQYAEAHQSDPKIVLESAFPLIQFLINTQILLPAGSPQASQTAASLEAGMALGEYRVACCVQVLQDTEIYQATSLDGRPVAIKIAQQHAGALTTYMLAREAAILHHLQGNLCPALLSTDEIQGRNYLVLEWVAGVSALEAAEELRPRGGHPDFPALAQLGCKILDTYAQLHRLGVLHGDIHPNNILVGIDGSVKLVDFGLSSWLNPSFKLAKIQRGGVAFFLDPEFARARLAKQPPPPVQTASEQYSLAVLLYYLLTGFHYLDFSLEEDVLLRQIATGSPLPFISHSLQAQPAIEAVLAQALAKEPSQRFNDLDAFADAFRGAAAQNRQDEGDAVSTLASDSLRALKTLHHDTLDRLGWHSPFLRQGLPRHPHASIFYGAAGAAYALYRMACQRADPDLLALADAWAVQAATQVDTPEGFYNPDIDLSTDTLGLITPYHTSSGVFAVQALIGQAMGDFSALSAAVYAFTNRIQAPCDNLDLTLGRSSILLTGALLYEMLPEKDLAEQSGLVKACHVNLERIWTQIDTFKPVRDSDELPNLGIAHGWGGIVYATLRWCMATNTPVPPGLEARLAQLAGCMEWVGRGGRWPWRQNLTQFGYMPGWCNGSAGFIFTWTQAHKLFPNLGFMALAEKAAWNCWEEPAEIGNLCCGLAGRAYALLHFYKHTRQPIWLQRAARLAELAAVSIRAHPLPEYKDFENSLYKGELGVAMLAADLENPLEAAFPFFEGEGE